MALVEVAGGVRLNYDDVGAGRPVLFIAGTGARGRTWHLHQVPACLAAGYRVVTFDNRGIPPSDVCDRLTIDDLVADTVGLIERLGLLGCVVVGSSMGAQIAQELSLARPDLVAAAVLMATRGRADAFCTALVEAEKALHDSGVRLPDEYAAVVRASQNLSPSTLADDVKARDWLEVFQLPTSLDGAKGSRAQLDVDLLGDRLLPYRRISVPCLVMAFADDLIAPPPRNREVAEAIPGACYLEIADAGHYGFLEQPTAVNAALLDFLQTHSPQ